MRAGFRSRAGRPLILVAWACSMVTGGCSPEPLELLSAFPDGAESVVVAVSAGADPRVLARDRAEGPVMLDDLSAPVRITVLFYDVSLFDLGLTAGELRPPEADEPSVPLSREWVEARRAEVRGGEPAPWVPISELEEALAAFRAFSPPACPEPEPVAELDGFDRVVSLFRLGPGEVGVLARRYGDQSDVILAHDGRRQRVVMNLPDGLTPRAATVDAEGNIYVSGHRIGAGRGVYEGPLSGPLSPLPANDGWGGGELEWLETSKDPAFPALYVLTSSSAAHVFRGGTWRSIWDGRGPGRLDDGGVIWLGPDDVLVLGENPERRWQVVRVTRGRPELEEFATVTAPSIMKRVVPVGPMLANDTGTLFVFTEAGFEALGSTPPGEPVSGITAVDRWLVYGTQTGELGLYDRVTERFCPSIPRARTVRGLEAVPGGFLMWASGAGGQRVTSMSLSAP